MIKSFPNSILQYSATHPDFRFIQIGAHDGIRHDPIHKYIVQNNWNGVLVEPIPEYFERLKNTYNNHPNLQLLNCAISNKDGVRIIYDISSHAPRIIWEIIRTKASFSKEVLMHRTWYIPGLSKYIETKTVKCRTLPSLIKLTKLNHIDLYVIDTEGYDYEIIKQINFNYKPPKYVYYEHFHLSQKDILKSWKLLINNGYQVSHDSRNTFATKAQV